MSLTDVLSLLQQGGPWLVVVAMVLFVLVAGQKGVWVWGREAARDRSRADRYEELLQKSLEASEAQVAILKAQNELLERMHHNGGVSR